MSENKTARIPVASHGLHKHTYNYPWLSSINFGDVMPCYINTLRKGEKDSPKAGLYSQLMPIAQNAFATGRYNFKCVFVPFKMVWRMWYYFSEQTEFHSNGSVYTPRRYPYLEHNVLSAALLSDTRLFTLDGSSTNYDVISYSPTSGVRKCYHVTAAGARVLRILGALGCMPSFNEDDSDPINILPILCYCKAFMDYYFPNNYVGNTYYRELSQLFEREDISFNNIVDGVVSALYDSSLNFYENSVFDLAWDNPVSPNVNSSSPSVAIKDVTNSSNYPMVVTNDSGSSELGTPNVGDVKPGNGTPFVGGTKSHGSTMVSSASGVLTKYVLDSLTSLSLWMKRRQIAGARLIERFLASRGVTLSNDSARISYFLGQRNVEIEVSGVENNTDTNLGELAGRGIASTGQEPLSFDCSAEDDGILLVIVSPVPDSNFPILLDGFATRKDFMDNYHAEFDKLGCAAVPSRVVQSTLDGFANYSIVGNGNVFGFLSQYWDEIQERPRLLGDFILKSRGADQLSAYHTFRLLSPSFARYHSYSFVRMEDGSQFQRLFYNDKQENLMLFLRWYGSQYKEKLPLGDSYDWDDDELNRKVSVVVGGSQK